MTALPYVRGTALASLVLAASACAIAQTQTPPATAYEPTVGQSGKDVVWVPTPQALVDQMLDMATGHRQRLRHRSRIGRRPHRDHRG